MQQEIIPLAPLLPHVHPGVNMNANDGVNMIVNNNVDVDINVVQYDNITVHTDVNNDGNSNNINNDGGCRAFAI